MIVLSVFLILVSSLGYTFNKISDQKTSIETQVTQLNQYKDEIETYKLDTNRTVSTRDVALIRSKDFDNSIDSTHLKLVETLKDLEISNNRVSELTDMLSVTQFNFEVQTIRDTIIVKDTNKVVLDTFNDTLIVNDTITRELENYTDKWTKIERIKYTNNSIAKYTIETKTPIKRIVHFEYVSKKGKLNKDRTKVGAIFHRLIGVDKPRVVETYVTENPHSKITKTETVIIENGSLKKKYRKLLSP